MGNSPNILKKIKSIYILHTIFSFVRGNKKLNMVKYNNDLKQKLNITKHNYMNLIIIDLNLIDELQNISSSKMNFINFDKDMNLKNLIRSGELDIYCFNNNNKFFIDKNYLVQNDVQK